MKRPAHIHSVLLNPDSYNKDKILIAMSSTLLAGSLVNLFIYRLIMHETLSEKL